MPDLLDQIADTPQAASTNLTAPRPTGDLLDQIASQSKTNAPAADALKPSMSYEDIVNPKPALISSPSDIAIKANAIERKYAGLRGASPEQQADLDSQKESELANLKSRANAIGLPFDVLKSDDQILAEKVSKAKLSTPEMQALVGQRAGKLLAPVERGVAEAAGGLANPENVLYAGLAEPRIATAFARPIMASMLLQGGTGEAKALKDIATGKISQGTEEAVAASPSLIFGGLGLRTKPQPKESYARNIESPVEVPQLEVRPQVGTEARVRHVNEEPAEPRPQTPGAPNEPAHEGQPVNPHELEPALLINGKLAVGDSQHIDHGQIMQKLSPDELQAYMKMPNKDGAHVFVRVDKNGNVVSNPMNREAAAKAIGFVNSNLKPGEAPYLNSEDLITRKEATLKPGADPAKTLQDLKTIPKIKLTAGQKTLLDTLESKSKANNSREAFARLKAQENAKKLTPQPDWKVSVQPAHGDVPGYVQIVDPRATEQSKSPTVDSLRQVGHDVPDFSKLPQGTYTWDEAVKQSAKEPAAVEPVQKTTPAAAVNPVETLNTAKSVKILAPKEATMLRVTDNSGKTAIQDLKSVQGENVFQGAGIKKIEAGTIGKNKQFIPLKGEVKVEPQLVGMGAAATGEVAEGSAGADIMGVRQATREKMAAAGQATTAIPGAGKTLQQTLIEGQAILRENPAAADRAESEFYKTGRFSYPDFSAVRAKENEVRTSGRLIEQQYGTESHEYDRVRDEVLRWSKLSKDMQTEWHKTGMAQQGEQDIDTGSVLVLETAYGKDFTKPQRKQATRIARDVTAGEKQAIKSAADLNQYLFNFLKDVPVRIPDKIGEAQKEFINVGKTHRLMGIFGPLSPEQVKYLWAYTKKFYTDAGVTDFEKIYQGVANDLGLKANDVRTALSRNTTGRKLMLDAYTNQYRARQLKSNAKLWVRAQQDPKLWRIIKSIPRAQFNLTVTGHATTWIGTHAGQNLFIPSTWPTLARNYARMWRVAFKTANWEMEANDLIRRKNWPIARRAGVNNDPFVRQGDYDSPEMTKFFEKLGAGKKGALGLLTMRQDFFDQAFDKLPGEVKNNPKALSDAARLIADDVNHSTGTTRIKSVEQPITSFLMFAPRLVAARWQWEFSDPAKAVIIKTFRHGTATPAEAMFANNILKRRAIFAATYISALGLNQILLNATGSKQKINLGDPRKSDWLGFKGFGMEVRPFSAGMACIRLLASEYKDMFINPQKRKPWEQPRSNVGSDLWRYAQQTASPTAGTLADLLTQQDYMERPLPSQPGRAAVNPPPPQPAWQRKAGIPEYTWGSYGLQRFSPIPFERAIQEAFQSQGMNQSKAAHWTRVILGSAAMATTGVLVEEDPMLNRNIPVGSAVPTLGR